MAITSERAELRFRAALAALQGLIACPTTGGTADEFASRAFDVADAVLKELDRKKEDRT
jgi:hypothetical protein